MSLIPALLPLMKPQVHSIDRKGRATISIRLLSNEWMKQPKAFTVTRCYRTHTQDLIIMVKDNYTASRVFTMDHIVGEANDLETWTKILPQRIGISNPSKHRYLGLTPFLTPLPPFVSSVPMETMRRKFLLVDAPGTIDREEGIWFDSNDDFGVFVVDIPTQFGWTHNRKSCTQILSEQWLKLYKTSIPTRSQYLPHKRLAMLDPNTYHCITPQTLDAHTNIPILCFHWKQQTVFRSTLCASHEVTFLDSDSDRITFPTWLKECPTLKDTSVSDWNLTMNSHWFTSFPVRTYLQSQPHPTQTLDNPDQIYAPITSPVRSLRDLWNQCVAHDMLSQRTIHQPLAYDTISSMSELDLQKAKFLRFHSSVLLLTKQLFQTHKDTDELPVFEGVCTAILPKKGIFVDLHMDTKPVIFLPFQNHPELDPDSIELYDTLFLRCRLQRNPDPFQKILWQIEDTEKESSK